MRTIPERRTQLTLEEAICAFLKGDYSSARRGYDMAADESSKFYLNSLYVRALAGQAEILDFRGTPLGAWQKDTSALRFCEKVECPPIRKYSIIYDMIQAAQSLDLENVALELTRVSVPIAAASGDATTYAYAIENLAAISGRMGDYATSDRAFAEASEVSGLGKPIRSIELYRAEWQSDRAEILTRRGAPKEAIDLLKQNESALTASDYQYGRLHFFTDMAVAELAIRDFVEARSNASAAVDETERSLQSLRSVTEKEQWQRENAPEYAKLVQGFLELKDDSGALDTWERYRYLAYKNAKTSPSNFSMSSSTSDKSSTSDPDQQVLVLALVDERYIGWLVDAKRMRVLKTITLGDRIQVHRLVTSFYHLCSDHDSKVRDIRSAGSRLYAALFQPLMGRMASSRELWIEMDPSLASIPVSALTLPDGRWMGAAYLIRILPAWWAIKPGVFAHNGAIQQTAQFIAVNGFQMGQENYSEASDIARLFLHAGIVEGSKATPQSLIPALKSADVFHFSGHASTDTLSNFILIPSAGRYQSELGAEALSMLNLPHCRIAVLAACNTAGSDPSRVEHPPDLRNALLLAGAQGVIASHWDVDDRATNVLMLAFYQQVIQGIPPAQSLQIAQTTVRSASSWEHPYYWSSFQFFVN